MWGALFERILEGRDYPLRRSLRSTRFGFLPWAVGCGIVIEAPIEQPTNGVGARRESMCEAIVVQAL
jgi:hypothetical protein